MLQNDCFSFHDCFYFHFWKWIFQVMDSYFSLLNLSFVENCHISIFTTFAKQSMINRLSNAINRNRSAAKISKVMSSTEHWVSPGKSWVRTWCGGTEQLVSFLAGGWSVKVTFTNFFASPPTSVALIVAGSTNWPECQLMQGIQMLTGEGMRQVSLSSSAVFCKCLGFEENHPLKDIGVWTRYEGRPHPGANFNKK